ncbi:MAG TPA: heavy-metal-associated domain-containing protein [Gammaproteobacteria bacterium]|nr:heavy-metal-associated domain-containing protein [Gammaproteobacteria bacterium]
MTDYCCDVIVHIDETLDNETLAQLEKTIGNERGIYSACINETARHLMVVDYDPIDISAQTILTQIHHQGLHAELIGL